MAATQLIEHWNTAMGIALVVAVPVLWWFWRQGVRRGEDAENQLDDLARLLVATLRRGEDLEAQGEGRFAGRRFRLHRTVVDNPGGASRRRYLTQLRLATPLDGVAESHQVAFKNIPRWAPKALRERPFIDRERSMPEGWFDDRLRQQVRAVFEADAGVGQLSIDAGELRWTIELFRSWSPLPSPEALRPRLFAMVELATTLEAAAPSQQVASARS